MEEIVLTFSKCIKHVPGKKSSIGDKPAMRRKEGPLDVGRMALVRGCGNVQDFRTQRQTVGLYQPLPFDTRSLQFLEMAHEDESLDDA